MKICQSCLARFEGVSWQCPYCGHRPTTLDGYIAFAPLLATASATGFDARDFRSLANSEEQNFWFRGRNKLIRWAIRRYCPQAKSFCEIGCGTGYVLRGIAGAFPSLALSGSEIAVAGLGFAEERNPSAKLFQMDATDIPFEDEFDAIGAFDVLEHIEHDRLAIEGIFRALHPGGTAIITVPQHKFLWSAQDRRAGHFRRYGTTELQDRLEAAGFIVELRTSFVTLLLPALAISRKLGTASDDQTPSLEFRLPRVANIALELTLDVERLLCARGVRLPVGGSQLLVARKPGMTDQVKNNSCSGVAMRFAERTAQSRPRRAS